MSKLILALFLVSCNVQRALPESQANIKAYSTRPPFEYVLVTQDKVSAYELLRRAESICKGFIDVQEYTKEDQLTTFYFKCKVGR